MDSTPIHKPSGWRGANTDAFWTKSSTYGQKYKCSTCGREVLGMGDALRMHWETCPHYVARQAEIAAREEQARRDADAWRAEHLGGFVLAVQACTDVQTLRALAHRIGYKEGT